MQAIVAAQLGVEGHGEHSPLTRRHRVAVHLAEDLHLRAVLGDPGGADEDPPDRRTLDAA